MGYPTGPLLSALAERVLANLKFIQANAPPWDSNAAKSNAPPFADTQLLISLLGILVFPQERTPAALGDLLSNYEGDLGTIFTIVHPKPIKGKVELVTITDQNGQDQRIDPRSIADLPRLLRNSIAHFNVRPINVAGRFGGIRIWNKRKSGDINFIADLDFDAFLPLAINILTQLSENKYLALDDPPDPETLI